MSECRACGAAVDGAGELCGHCCPSCGFEPSAKHRGMCCDCFTEMHYEREALLEARWAALQAWLESVDWQDLRSNPDALDPNAAGLVLVKMDELEAKA